MKRWDIAQNGAIYEDILSIKSDTLSIYALESFAKLVDSSVQDELMRNLVLSHAEIARELEASKQRLTEAHQIARLGRWDINYKTDTRYWSESLYDILQLDHSLPPNRELLLRRIHPDDLPLVVEITKKLLITHEPWMDRYRIVLPDGSTRWLHIRMYSDFDLDGNPVRSYGTMQDITTMKEAEDKLEQYSKRLEEMVSEKVKETSDAQMATIFALVKLAESRDDETGAHIERTASFCRLLAEKARTLPRYASVITDEYLTAIYRASPLHDIGKVGISDLILLKPGKLTPEEFAIMKTHVEIGYQTLKSVDKRYMNNTFIQMGLEITRYHHEKWDGSGYLAALKGEDIPLSARIMALSDVYDALRSKRVYKPAYTHEKSMEIIEEGRGKHFDPTLTDLFLNYHKEFEALFDSLI